MGDVGNVNFDPGPWAGRTTVQARQRYDDSVKTSQAKAVASGFTASNIVPDRIKTLAKRVVVIACDWTGSMHEAPGVMFEKMGYFDIESGTYLGEDRAVSIMAFGDANGPKPCAYPFQVRHFVKGTAFEKELEAVVKTGFDGGGQRKENSELAVLYCCRNVDMPNVEEIRHKPILTIITDEAPYGYVDTQFAEVYAHVKLTSSLTTVALFKEAMEKFSIYVVLKPYGAHAYDPVALGNKMDLDSEAIYRVWEKLIGTERIAPLPDARRIVDVLFGIFAQENDMVPYFKDELHTRQSPQQAAVVEKSLESILRLPKSPARGSSGGHSVLRLPAGST